MIFGKNIHKGLFRTNSLDIRSNEVKRSPVVRNISSPIAMQYANPHRWISTFPLHQNLMYNKYKLFY